VAAVFEIPLNAAYNDILSNGNDLLAGMNIVAWTGRLFL
jgi:hypothetical protein